MAALKVETDFISNIAATTLGQAAILVIMYFKTLKADLIIFIDRS